MAQSTPVDSVQPAQSWWLLPSWVLSVALHASIIWLFSLGYGSLDGGDPGVPDGDFHDVGVFVNASGDQSDALESQENQPAETAERPVVNPVAQSFQEPVEQEQPPVSLPMLTNIPATIGPGMPSSNAPGRILPGDILNGGVRPDQAFSPAPGGPGGPSRIGDGSTKFFGIRDQGEVFVYVLDSSASMAYTPEPGKPSAMYKAKEELMASLGHLTPKHRFQVIFYNKSPRQLGLKGGHSEGLIGATHINLTLASQEIRGVVPESGTDHMPALRQAMRLKPDVIFFLTDADHPQLEAADLNELTTLNRDLNKGRTRIHCVEFGRFGESLSDNFLKKTARMFNGTYRYRDVTRIEH